MGNYVILPVRNYVLTSAPQLGNYVIADTVVTCRVNTRLAAEEYERTGSEEHGHARGAGLYSLASMFRDLDVLG
jgi:hypothetical protein